MSWLLRKRASSVGSIASTSTDASSPSDNHELQASVIKATRPMTNPAAPNELNADPHGLEEIAEQARGNRKGFVNDLVKMLKARLKKGCGAGAMEKVSERRGVREVDFFFFFSPPLSPSLPDPLPPSLSHPPCLAFSPRLAPLLRQSEDEKVVLLAIGVFDQCMQ
eukprot:605903-Rhodomonas_salina.1